MAAVRMTARWLNATVPRVVMRGHAFMQNIRRGHYELGVVALAHRRVAHAFGELTRAI